MNKETGCSLGLDTSVRFLGSGVLWGSREQVIHCSQKYANGTEHFTMERKRRSFVVTSFCNGGGECEGFFYVIENFTWNLSFENSCVRDFDENFCRTRIQTGAVMFPDRKRSNSLNFVLQISLCILFHVEYILFDIHIIYSNNVKHTMHLGKILIILEPEKTNHLFIEKKLYFISIKIYL